MTIIREYVRTDTYARVIARSNCYAHDLEYIARLFSALENDFNTETLHLSKAEIAHYGGQRYAGTYGVEYVLNANVPIPDTYTQIAYLEYKL